MTTFKAVFKYLKTVLSHKWFVFVAGRWFGVPIWRLIVHDASKFSRAEFMPYVHKHVLKDRGGDRWTAALIHHYNHNDHHLDYWILRGVPVVMPDVCVREMIADWFAASRAYDGTWPEKGNWPFFANAFPKMRLHAKTRKAVERLMAEHWKDKSCSPNTPQGDLF